MYRQVIVKINCQGPMKLPPVLFTQIIGRRRLTSQGMVGFWPAGCAGLFSNVALDQGYTIPWSKATLTKRRLTTILRIKVPMSYFRYPRVDGGTGRPATSTRLGSMMSSV